MDTSENKGTKTPLLFAYVLDGKGGGKQIGWEDSQKWSPSAEGEILWMHMHRTEPGGRDWLQNTIGISRRTSKVLTSDFVRPRAYREDDTLVASLRGINLEPKLVLKDMVSLQIWSDGQRVLTLRSHPVVVTRSILAEFEREDGPCDAGELITEIVGLLVAKMNHPIAEMNDFIDSCEETAPDDDTKQLLDRIGSIRRNSLALQRHMGPQHAALEAIEEDAPAWFKDQDRREIVESIEQLGRFIDDINVSKESAVVLMDELHARAVARAQRTNYLLTIVAGVFLPLTFLTGLLGINVDGIPGTNSSYAFWIVVALCALIVIAQIVAFRKWKWL